MQRSIPSRPVLQQDATDTTTFLDSEHTYDRCKQEMRTHENTDNNAGNVPKQQRVICRSSDATAELRAFQSTSDGSGGPDDEDNPGMAVPDTSTAGVKKKSVPWYKSLRDAAVKRFKEFKKKAKETYDNAKKPFDKTPSSPNIKENDHEKIDWKSTVKNVCKKVKAFPGEAVIKVGEMIRSAKSRLKSDLDEIHRTKPESSPQESSPKPWREKLKSKFSEAKKYVKSKCKKAVDFVKSLTMQQVWNGLMKGFFAIPMLAVKAFCAIIYGFGCLKYGIASFYIKLKTTYYFIKKVFKNDIFRAILAGLFFTYKALRYLVEMFIRDIKSLWSNLKVIGGHIYEAIMECHKHRIHEGGWWTVTKGILGTLGRTLAAMMLPLVEAVLVAGVLYMNVTVLAAFCRFLVVLVKEEALFVLTMLKEQLVRLYSRAIKGLKVPRKVLQSARKHLRSGNVREFARDVRQQFSDVRNFKDDIERMGCVGTEARKYYEEEEMQSEASFARNMSGSYQHNNTNTVPKTENTEDDWNAGPTMRKQLWTGRESSDQSSHENTRKAGTGHPERNTRWESQDRARKTSFQNPKRMMKSNWRSEFARTNDTHDVPPTSTLYARYQINDGDDDPNANLSMTSDPYSEKSEGNWKVTQKYRKIITSSLANSYPNFKHAAVYR